MCKSVNAGAPYKFPGASSTSMIVVTAAYSMSQHIENLTRATTTSCIHGRWTKNVYIHVYISTATIAGVCGWESNGGRVKCLDARAPSWRTWFHPVAHAPLPTSNLSLYTLDTHTQIHNTHTHRRRRRRCVWLCVFIDEWSASRNGAGQRQVERVGGPHVSNQNDEAVTVSSSLPCCCWMVFHRAVISLQDQQ